MNERGYTLLEVLIASALVLAVSAGLAAMTMPVRDAFERSVGAVDLTGGSRAVIERLAAEVREAGADASVGRLRVALIEILPTLIPLEDLDAPGAGALNRAVRILRVPLLAPQGGLVRAVDVGDIDVPLRLDEHCTAIGVACGFTAGALALLRDDEAAVIVSVASVAAGGVVRLAAGVPRRFEAGSVLAGLAIATYGLRDEPDGSHRLVRVTPGSEQPLLDNVVLFEVAVAGRDERHVDRVDFVLRVQAPSAAHRGPAGVLFRRAGTATRPAQWVPDIETRISVATRNQS
jgi:prepilin-type N-terminal cleavage/methylation domain-containing protein